MQTDSVFVVPSLGAIVAGHILVLPKSHYYSVGEIAPSQLTEFEAVVRESWEILTKTYGYCSAFEHGCVENVGKAGACIDHAHFHLIPIKTNLRPGLEKRFGRGRAIHTLHELRRFIAEKTPYLYYAEPDGRAEAYEALEAPSQFFRQLICAATDQLRNWDWKADLRTSVVMETYLALKGSFSELEKVVYAAQS